MDLIIKAGMDGVRGFQADGDEGVVFIDLRDTVRVRRLTQKMSGFIVSTHDGQSRKFKKLNNSTQLEIAGDVLQRDVKKTRKRKLGCLCFRDTWWSERLFLF